MKRHGRKCLSISCGCIRLWDLLPLSTLMSHFYHTSSKHFQFILLHMLVHYLWNSQPIARLVLVSTSLWAKFTTDLMTKIIIMMVMRSFRLQNTLYYNAQLRKVTIIFWDYICRANLMFCKFVPKCLRAVHSVFVAGSNLAFSRIQKSSTCV